METTMQTPPPAGHVDVTALARCAALDLSPERLAAVEAILSAWIPAANELSRKMSEPAHQVLMPVTVFTHAHEAPEGGE
jgi:hypothetical protein